MSSSPLLDDVRQAAKDYQVSEHRLRLAVAAACAADVPIASIARTAGVTRQTVYNWSADYGVAGGLAVSATTPLGELPIQRPRAVKKAPVLILTRRRGMSKLVWDGRCGKAAGYAGDRLGVTVPGKIVDVIAESWALVGDSTGEGRRPDIGDLVICRDGRLGTVHSDTGPDGDIQVEIDGIVFACSWWAIVLPTT
jgi:transposase-like protein